MLIPQINPNSKSVSCQDPSSPAGSGAAAAKHQRRTHNLCDGDFEPATLLAKQQKNKWKTRVIHDTLLWKRCVNVWNTLAKMLFFLLTRLDKYVAFLFKQTADNPTNSKFPKEQQGAHRRGFIHRGQIAKVLPFTLGHGLISKFGVSPLGMVQNPQALPAHFFRSDLKRDGSTSIWCLNKHKSLDSGPKTCTSHGKCFHQKKLLR